MVVLVIAMLVSVFGLVLLGVRRLIRIFGVDANDLDITAFDGGSGGS